MGRIKELCVASLAAIWAQWWWGKGVLALSVFCLVALGKSILLSGSLSVSSLYNELAQPRGSQM